TKDVANLVSDADLEAERAVVEVIRRTYPGHEILAEEAHTGDTAAEHLWVVDPLDGTNNFAHQIPQFAVSVAYYRRGVAQCGGIYNPTRDDWHVAVRGQGAYFNGERTRVGEQTSLGEVMVGVGFYYDRGEKMEATLAAVGDLKRDHQIHGIRRFGAATLDLCMVALGQLGAYFEFTLSPWDFAAGRLFVEEAGGRVTTCLGDPLPLARSSILATNGHLHDAMLAVVRPRYPGGD
ncbi:MAG: inositol monophosphatase, partial [Planctomycetia bacterium]|nr:inositol monophosphatase [Planctomycetia bacterium]